jgi:hypothetical protein
VASKPIESYPFTTREGPEGSPEGNLQLDVGDAAFGDEAADVAGVDTEVVARVVDVEQSDR